MLAQVGINIPNPKAAFHVDGGKNNEATGNVSLPNQLDDFVITKDGFVGIGTNTPTTNLNIKTKGTPSAPVPGIKIEDGTQIQDFVLTSDSNGNGSWQPARLGLIKGINGAGFTLTFTSLKQYLYTGSYIDLPPGKWLVSAMQLVAATGVLEANDWMWLKSSFSDQTNLVVGDVATISSDLTIQPTLISGLIQGPASGTKIRYSMMQGTVFIDNKSGSIKRYKYIAGYNEMYGTQKTTTFLRILEVTGEKT